MKKNFWKKLLSLVLVTALVVGTLKISDTKTMAEDHSTVSVETDGIKVTKSAKFIETNGTTGKVQIDFVVDGKTAQITEGQVGKTDIVLVIDTSGSMVETGKKGKVTTDRLTPAKNAANAFVTSILTAENKDSVRIGVVSYATKASQKQGLTNDTKKITDSIKGLSANGGTNIQDGLAKAKAMLDSSAEGTTKIIVVLTDGEPTYSYEGYNQDSKQNKTKVNTGDEVRLYKSFRTGDYYIHGEGNRYSTVVGLETISQAYLNKNSGIKIYSIGYDTSNNSNAQYVMKNVASSLDNFYAASSGTTTDTSALISNVMVAISKEVEKDIAAARGTKIVDTFPASMTVTAAEGATIASDKKSIEWTLGDLKKENKKQLTIYADVDLTFLAQEYADKYKDDEYTTAAQVIAALAEGKEILFDLNKLVTLSYTDKTGKLVENTDINASSNYVPQDTVKAYDYTVTYKLDDVEIANSKISGTKFAGETVQFADIADYTNDNVKYDKSRTTTSLENNAYSFVINDTKDVVVNYYSNVFSVIYKNINGNEVKSFDNIKYGTTFNETIPTVPSIEGKENGKWSKNPTGKEITENWTITPEYDDCKYTVTYEIYVDDILVTSDQGAPAAVNEILWNGETTLPDLTNRTYAINVDEDTHKVTYTEGSWTITSGTATISDDKVKVTGIKSDVVVTKEFTSKTENATVYKVVNIGDDKSAQGWSGAYQFDNPTAPSLAAYKETTDDTNTFTYGFVMENGAVKWVKDTDGYLTIYTATRSSIYINYPVTFTFTDAKNAKHSETVNYHYGDTPSLPDSLKNYTATVDTAEWDYTFNAWPDFNAVTEATSYEASETRVKQRYDYAFKLVVGSNAAVTVSSGTVEYGTEVTAPSVDTNAYAVTGSTINFTDYKQSSVTITGKYEDTAYITYSVNEYPVSITFIAVDESGNEDPTSLMNENVAYGTKVTFPSLDSYIKSSNAKFTYSELVFNGCKDNSDFTVEGAVAITIKQTETRNKYTVTFVIEDVDGKLTSTKSCEIPYDGDATVYAPSLTTAAEREAMADTDGVALDKKYTYTVTGWDKAFNKITEDIIVTAEITKVEKTYTVNFEILRVGATEAAQVGTFTTTYGAVVKAPVCMVSLNTDEFTYALTYPKGWIAGADFTVTDETAGTYTAVETNVKNEYTIKFVLKYTGDEDRTKTIAEVKVPYGTTATAPAIDAKYFKENGAQWTYPEKDTIFFTDYANVVKNDTVVVEYKATLNNYTVTFVDENGSKIYGVTEPYGTTVAAIVSAVKQPSKADSEDGHYTYEFAGWTEVKKEGEVFPETLDKDLSYKATYTAIERIYKVYFVDEDGTYFDNRAPYTVAVTWGAIVPAANKVEADGLAEAVALKLCGPILVYSFNVWEMISGEDKVDGSVALTEAVKGDMTFYASYTSASHEQYTITYHNISGSENDTFATAKVDPGYDYTVRPDGPSAEALNTPTTNYYFLGWSNEAEYIPEPFETMLNRDVAVVSFFGETEPEMEYVYDEETGLVTDIKYVVEDVDLYPVYASSEHLYTVTFHNYDGEVIDTCTGIHYADAATAPAVTPSRASVSDATSVTTYTFKGWDKDFSKVVEDMDVYAQFNSTTTPTHILPILPTAEPTPEPTAVPTAEPTPVPEEIIEIVEEPETPEGTPAEPTEEPTPEPTATPTPEVIEVIEEPETPEGTPDEEIEIELDETPQGLPKTGVVAAGVLYGIGSACIIIGSVLTSRTKRKKEEQ